MALRLAQNECVELSVHAHSVPQFHLHFAPKGVLQSLSAALSALSLPQICLRQLLDVVDHAVQVPLRVDLVAPSVIQAAQPLVVPDVGKYRLYSSNALAVELPAPG